MSELAFNTRGGQIGHGFSHGHYGRRAGASSKRQRRTLTQGHGHHRLCNVEGAVGYGAVPGNRHLPGGQPSGRGATSTG